MQQHIFFWNMKVDYCIHKCLALLPILTEIHPIQNLRTLYLKVPSQFFPPTHALFFQVISFLQAFRPSPLLLLNIIYFQTFSNASFGLYSVALRYRNMKLSSILTLRFFSPVNGDTVSEQCKTFPSFYLSIYKINLQ
jgi:hypothetical protein